MEAPHVPYSLFPVVSCGVDWLTVTSKRRGVSNALEDFGYRLVHEENAADGRASAAIRLGFTGHRTDTMFIGRNGTHVMWQCSGSACTPLTAEAITVGERVSRIDLQVTVFCEGEQPHLARWTRNQLVTRPEFSDGRRKLRYLEGHPDGETLEVGRRVSDAFGRLYDKTAEASLGLPRLVWRYELEAKGERARRLVSTLAECGVRPTLVSRLVHDYYTRTGVEPAFSPPSDEIAFQPTIATPSRDVLTWMRSSLSITIAKAINRHGREVVLQALGLSDLIRRDAHNGELQPVSTTVPSDIALHPTRSAVPERILLH